MEIILIALSPFVVAVISQGVKKIIAKDWFTTGLRKNVIRMAVAVLSYGSVIGATVISGGSVDPIATETFVMTLMTFLGSTGTYYLAKN